jgi:hypothetical protein
MDHSTSQQTVQKENEDKVFDASSVHTGYVKINRKRYCYFHTPDSPHGQIILYLSGDQEIINCKRERQLAFAAYLSHITKKRVLPINPFLNAVHLFPDALNNTAKMYSGFFSEGYTANNIIIGADSTAGNLALALMLVLKDKGIRLPKALFLFSPLLDLTLSGESLESKSKDDTVLSKEKLLRWTLQYYSGNDPRNAYISPVTSPNRFFPPMLIQVGADEILLSDSIDFSNKLRAVGCPIELKVWEKTQHAWQSFIQELPQAERSLREVGRFVAEHLPGKARK